jgi:hypothetical protein
MSYKQKSPFNSFRDPKRSVRNFQPTEFKMPDLSPIINKSADGTDVTDDRKTDSEGEKGRPQLKDANAAMDKIKANEKAIVEKEKPEHIKIRERYAADKAKERAAFKQIRKNARLADKKTTAEEKDRFTRDKIRMQEYKFDKSKAGRKKEQDKIEAEKLGEQRSKFNIGERIEPKNEFKFDLMKSEEPDLKLGGVEEFKKQNQKLKQAHLLERAKAGDDKAIREQTIVNSIDEIGGGMGEIPSLPGPYSEKRKTENRMKLQRHMNSPLNMNSRSKIEKSGEVKKQNNFSSGRGSFKLKSPFGVVTEEESFQPKEGVKSSKGDPVFNLKPKKETKPAASDSGVKSSVPSAPVVSPPKVEPPKADPPKADPPKAAPTGVDGPRSNSPTSEAPTVRQASTSEDQTTTKAPTSEDQTTTKAPTSESPANKLNEITQQSTNRSQGTQIAQTRSGQGSVTQESMGQPQDESSGFSSENEKANFNTGSSSNKATQVANTMNNARSQAEQTNNTNQTQQNQNIITPTSGFFSGNMGVNPNTTSGVGNDIKNTTGYSKQIEAANQNTKQQAIDNLAKNPNAQTPGSKQPNEEAMGTPIKQPPVTSPPPPPPPPPPPVQGQGQNNCGNASSSREAQFLNNAMPMFSTMKSMGPNKALQGGQHKLPGHLKKAILNSKSPGMYDNV